MENGYVTVLATPDAELMSSAMTLLENEGIPFSVTGGQPAESPSRDELRVSAQDVERVEELFGDLDLSDSPDEDSD